ncbi:Predicted E3 ubiquitin ligase [Phaffia rhodozyma]|uniref:Predicted E3 ubiquitin ligase n=1 Tax=Phaffia rhodozyma TaxID=264483 RepID=A0A0F7SR80_PHARH|nr:Predicted E3 ubiquitin ligase [Phaffia rhodozyma]
MMVVWIVLVCSVCARGYIPAFALNNTAALSRNDSSMLDFIWVQGTYNAYISLQLTADANTSDYFPNEFANGGLDRGALVHFSEDLAQTNDSSNTPWIAFVSCDSNITDMSMENDIFSLARDRGAMAALLYSNTSEGCQITQNYLDNYEKPLDVYTTRNKNDAIIIESQFEQHCAAAFHNFNPSLLNSSYSSVTSLLSGIYPLSNTYVVAFLRAFNATSTDTTVVPTATATAPGSTSSSGSNAQSGGGKGKSLAMIILYVVIGCVAAIVISVIALGVFRSIRHPERYGPRRRVPAARQYPYNYDDPAFDDFSPSGTESYVPQTRTAGLARAIVDSFPIVRYVRRGGASSSEGAHRPLPENGDSPVKKKAEVGLGGHHRHLGEDEVWTLNVLRQSNQAGSLGDEEDESKFDDPSSPSSPTDRRTRNSSTSRLASDGTSRTIDEGPGQQNIHYRQEASDANETISKTQDVMSVEDVEESCPICLLEFEDGDGIRVLPCQGSHRFHKDCIDSWLIEISAVCPLCRKDFSQNAILPSLSATTPAPTFIGTPAGPNGINSTNSTNTTGPSARVQGFLARRRSRVSANRSVDLRSQSASNNHRNPNFNLDSNTNSNLSQILNTDPNELGRPLLPTPETENGQDIRDGAGQVRLNASTGVWG